MLLKYSFMYSTDNIGILKGMCVGIYRKKATIAGKLNNKVLLSTRKRNYFLIKKRRIENKQLFIGYISNLRYSTHRLNGHYLKFTKNRYITGFSLDSYKGLRVVSPLSKETRINAVTVKMLQLARNYYFV